MYNLKPLNGGSSCRKSPNILRGAASARNTCNLWHANFHVCVFSQSGLGVRAFKFRLRPGPPSPSSSTFSPLINLNPTWHPSLYYLTPQWHRRYACMGCMTRCGEPIYFNDYQSAATHYARSQSCSKSSRRIKTVSVQLHSRPQYVGYGEAGGGGAAGVWCPQPAPSRRPGGNDIIKHKWYSMAKVS